MYKKRVHLMDPDAHMHIRERLRKRPWVFPPSSILCRANGHSAETTDRSKVTCKQCRRSPRFYEDNSNLVKVENEKTRKFLAWFLPAREKQRREST